MILQSSSVPAVRLGTCSSRTDLPAWGHLLPVPRQGDRWDATVALSLLLWVPPCWQGSLTNVVCPLNIYRVPRVATICK